MNLNLTLRVAALALLTALLTGCDPEGQACYHPGDVRTENGVVLHCKNDGDGNARWAR